MLTEITDDCTIFARNFVPILYRLIRYYCIYTLVFVILIKRVYSERVNKKKKIQKLCDVVIEWGVRL